MAASTAFKWVCFHFKFEMSISYTLICSTITEWVFTTEELPDNVFDVHVVLICIPSSFLVPNTFIGTHVIGSSLLRILQSIIRLGYFLELLSCQLWIVPIHIRMVLFRQFLIPFLNLILICIFRHPKNFVVVLRWLFLLLRVSILTTSSWIAPTTTFITKASKLLCLNEEELVAAAWHKWIGKIIAILTRVSK